MDPNQNPGGGSIPLHRFQELQEQLKKMEQQNTQLRHTVDNILLTRQQQQPTKTKEPLFKPEVEQALDEKLQEALNKETSKFKQAVGFLTEENDHLKFVQKFGYETMEKYGDKINQVRDEANRIGKYVSREEAYQRIFFDEHSKKPPVTPETPKGPVFDPYLKTWIQPETQNPPVTTAPQAPAPAVPQAPQQTLETKTPEAPTLPPMGPPNVPTQQAPLSPVPGSLTLETDAKGLEAWENKYGNQPL